MNSRQTRKANHRIYLIQKALSRSIKRINPVIVDWFDKKNKAFMKQWNIEDVK